MKSLSSKSILDRVKRIEKKYAKSSQIIDKHLEDEELELDLEDVKGYVTGTNKSSLKDKKPSQLIYKHHNARLEREASKTSRVADREPCQSVVNFLGKSEESHLKSFSCCYSSDDSEMMSKGFGIPQTFNNSLSIKKQGNSYSMEPRNPKPNVSGEVNISTVKYHDQENKFPVHDDSSSNTNIAVNPAPMKLDLKFQEEGSDEEIQTMSENDGTLCSNSPIDMHLNIFPFESLQLENDEETILHSSKKNVLKDLMAADVNSLSSISSPVEILPTSNSLKTPSKYSACENSIDDFDEDNSFNFNLLSIGELMEDIKSEQSNKLYVSERLALANEYNDKPQLLDKVISENETCKSTKISIRFSPVNSVAKDKSNEIKEESSVSVEVVSDIDVGVDWVEEEEATSAGERGADEQPDLSVGRRAICGGDNDPTSIDEDIAEELDLTLCSGGSKQSEERGHVESSALNDIHSFISNIPQSHSVGEEKHLTIESNTQDSNENVTLESCDKSVQKKKKKKKKFHDSILKKIPEINKTSCHVSCQTNPLFFPESDVFSKKIEEILGSSLFLNPNLANNITMKTDPIKLDGETSSAVPCSPVERGFHWALSQQVELTKHFIKSEYNMYAMCMSAIRELSSDYKPLSMRTHRKKKK